MSTRDDLIERWNNDPEFRARFRDNPEQALSDAGIVLSDDERAALAELDLGADDEALAERINPKKNC